jgi:hypothetical protein
MSYDIFPSITVTKYKRSIKEINKLKIRKNEKKSHKRKKRHTLPSRVGRPIKFSTF